MFSAEDMLDTKLKHFCDLQLKTTSKTLEGAIIYKTKSRVPCLISGLILNVQQTDTQAELPNFTVQLGKTSNVSVGDLITNAVDQKGNELFEQGVVSRKMVLTNDLHGLIGYMVEVFSKS